MSGFRNVKILMENKQTGVQMAYGWVWIIETNENMERLEFQEFNFFGACVSIQTNNMMTTFVKQSVKPLRKLIYIKKKRKEERKKNNTGSVCAMLRLEAHVGWD